MVRKEQERVLGGFGPEWISERFEVSKTSGQFMIDGVPLDTIASQIQPPFFVYSAQDIIDRYQGLERVLKPNNVNIYYSLKANTSLAIVTGLVKLGAGLEVASIGELEAARAAGADPKKVSFAGPVKTAEELEYAIEWGVGGINVESEREFERINEIAERLGKRQTVGIRVNPEQQVSEAGGYMGGGSQKFGIDVEKIDAKFVDRLHSLPNIDLTGIHVFAATQMLNKEAFLTNLNNVCEIGQKLNELFKIRYIDFGGGLGIPYKQSAKKLPIVDIARSIGGATGKYSFLKENDTLMYVEPGRYLVGPSGIYVARVDHVKDSRGEQFVMVDGGWHHMMRPSPKMPFGSHPIYNLSRLWDNKTQPMTVAGSLCTSIDMLGQNIPLPTGTREGDFIGVFNAGAYGRSQSPRDFLSHPTAAEVLVGDGKFAVIRPSEHPRDLLRNQTVPENLL